MAKLRSVGVIAWISKKPRVPLWLRVPPAITFPAPPSPGAVSASGVLRSLGRGRVAGLAATKWEPSASTRSLGGSASAHHSHVLPLALAARWRTPSTLYRERYGDRL